MFTEEQKQKYYDVKAITELTDTLRAYPKIILLYMMIQQAKCTNER